MAAQGLQVHPAGLSRVLCIFSSVSWGNETYVLVLSMCGCGYTSMCLSVPPSLSSRNSESIDCFQPYLTILVVSISNKFNEMGSCGKANHFESPPSRKQLQNKSTIYLTPETPYGRVWKIIYQCTTHAKSLAQILPFHRYSSRLVSKHKCVGKQASSTLALTEQFPFLIFHCNCFLLIWMLKCIIGHNPEGPGNNGSDGRGEDLTPQFGCNMLFWPIYW